MTLIRTAAIVIVVALSLAGCALPDGGDIPLPGTASTTGTASTPAASPTGTTTSSGPATPSPTESSAARPQSKMTTRSTVDSRPSKTPAPASNSARVQLPENAEDARETLATMSSGEKAALLQRYREMSPEQQRRVRQLACERYGLGC